MCSGQVSSSVLGQQVAGAGTRALWMGEGTIAEYFSLTLESVRVRTPENIKEAGVGVELGARERVHDTILCLAYLHHYIGHTHKPLETT